MPSSAQRQDVDESGRNWELFENGGGLLRTQDDTQDDITHVFSHDGTLLTGSASSDLEGVADTHAPTSAGGRLGRLLRYYMGNAGRHVVLHDGNGLHWPARITATRWHGKRQGRSWSFRSSDGASIQQQDSVEKEA